MLCLSGFELYFDWVPLINRSNDLYSDIFSIQFLKSPIFLLWKLQPEVIRTLC